MRRNLGCSHLQLLALLLVFVTLVTSWESNEALVTDSFLKVPTVGGQCLFAQK